MKRRFLRFARKVVRALPRTLRHLVLRRLVSVDTTPPPGLSIRLAQSPHELRTALKLLHDAYVGVGLMDPDPSGLRITPYQSQPGTRTIIAELDGEIVATVSLIADGIQGLPLETVFEIGSYRKGRKLAEISAFAVRPDHRGHGCRLLLPLLNYTYLLGRNNLGLDAFVMAPLVGRVDLYEAVLLAERLHDETVSYPYGNGLEVAALAFDLHNAEHRFARHYDRTPLQRNLYHYFFVDPPDVFELPPKGGCEQTAYDTVKELQDLHMSGPAHEPHRPRVGATPKHAAHNQHHERVSNRRRGCLTASPNPTGTPEIHAH